MAHGMRPCLASRPIVEELESRVLYSADLAPLIAGLRASPPQAEYRLIDARDSVASNDAAAVHATRPLELVVVDARVEDADVLLTGLNSDTGRHFEVIRLASDRDGITRISELLRDRTDVAAVHFLAHGEEGRLLLGNRWLDAAALAARSPEIAAWGLSLTADADLLIYGCDVGANAAGREFVRRLAEVTRADVAASDDLTGNQQVGGDWILELAAGTIQTGSALSLSAQQAWNSVLLASTNEIQVNQATSNDQLTSAENRGSQRAVALDAAGNYVVVWTSKNQDGSNDGVYARRFDATGVPITGEILVNATTNDNQRSARVTSDSAGNFVVTWTSSNQDGTPNSVYVRRFNAGGVALTAETRVNTTASGAQTDSVIAMSVTTGDYVIAWQGEGPGDTAGIFFRRFNADGTAKDATDRLANLTNAGTETDPAVTMVADGRFVIVWQANNNIYFQRFDAAGAALAGAVQVDAGIAPVSGAAVASDAAGNFAVAYRSDNAFTPLAGVWVRGFNADGTSKFLWSQVAGGDATSPSIEMASDGSFVVVYEQSGDALDVFARKYNANGSAAGAAFQVNQTTANDQANASVAAVDANNYVVAWSGKSSGDSVGVVVRQYGPPVQITATQDTYIDNGSTSNYGPSASLVVDRSGGNLGDGRALLQFDLSAIPAGATITGATLLLQASANASPFMIDVYRLTEAWVEGNGGTSAANWNNRLSGTAWTDINGASVDQTPAATWSALPPAGAGVHSWDLTNLVRAWQNGTSANYGILLGSRATGTSAVTYDSSEGVTPPRLVVSFTLDAAPSITSNGGGAGASISVAENVTAVTTVTATDADLPAQTLTYSISGGADAGKFAINASTGVLSFSAAPNFEAPTDSGTNNVYNVTVRVSDGSRTDTQAIAVTVSDANEFPVGAISDANAAVNSVAENAGVGTLTGITATATDPDGTTNAISYTLDDSAGGRFAINAATGVLTVAGVLDYETSTSHVVTVRATSADGSFSTALFTINVTNVNELGVGTISDVDALADQVAENSAIGTLVGLTASAIDPDVGDVVSYSLIDDAGGRFAINPTTGVVTVAGALDAETATSHTIVVRADSTDLSFNTQTFTIAMADANEFAIGAVSDVDTAANAVDENAAIGTQVGITASAVDADATNSTTTYILDDSAGGRFAIDGVTGIVTVAGAIDREVAPSHAIVVRATSADGSFSTQGFAIAVNPLNDNAADITSDGGAAAASISVAENATAVTTVTATDADLPVQTLTYSLVGGADQALFSIDSGTGALSFVSAPDYETPSDLGADNAYEVTVQVGDGSLTTTQAISVTVNPLNDNSPDITSDGGLATASINVAENTTAVTTVTATDADLPAQTLTYSIGGGADAVKFTIDASTGVLSFANAPDHESPSDFGADNIYEVTVQVSDGTLTDSQAIAVTVTPVNDNNPVITSNGGGASASINVAENVTAVTTVTATAADLPAPTLTYSISGGADQLLFSINASTGVLSFSAAPNFEAPIDAGTNNVYDLIVQASNGTLIDTQAIAVTVGDANEFPVGAISDANAAVNSVAENAGVGTLTGVTATATDPDGTTNAISYTLDDSAGGRFAINAATGVLTVAGVLDYETSTGHVVTVRAASADGSFSTQGFAIAVNPLNDNAPDITSDGGAAAASISVAENATAVTTVTATDADLPAQTLTYSISGGADQALFSINTSNGALSFVSAPDYETPNDMGADNVYEVTVRVSDGTLSDSQAISVTVNPLSDNAPAITSDGGAAKIGRAHV